jgi:hypothetical protein
MRTKRRVKVGVTDCYGTSLCATAQSTEIIEVYFIGRVEGVLAILAPKSFP